MHHWDSSWTGWHMGWMGLWWILGAALIALVVWMVARSTRGPRDSGEPPETTLKRRYAKGEVDEQTYERMLAELRK